VLQVGTIPSAEQTEVLNKELKELAGSKEAIDNIPDEEQHYD
jgi:hypothetical protein